MCAFESTKKRFREKYRRWHNVSEKSMEINRGGVVTERMIKEGNMKENKDVKSKTKPADNFRIIRDKIEDSKIRDSKILKCINSEYQLAIYLLDKLISNIHF